MVSINKQARLGAKCSQMALLTLVIVQFFGSFDNLLKKGLSKKL